MRRRHDDEVEIEADSPPAAPLKKTKQTITKNNTLMETYKKRGGKRRKTIKFIKIPRGGIRL